MKIIYNITYEFRTTYEEAESLVNKWLQKNQ